VNLLAGRELRRRLAARPPLIEGLVDPEAQIQMNGVDFTLREVASFGSESGAIAFDNGKRRIPPTEPLPPDSEGWWRLQPGVYWILFNEIVHIPADVFAIARTRSSVLRSGAAIQTALWDSGYEGRSGSLLVVHHPAGIELERNARVMQLVFFQMAEEAESLYRGQFQGENIKT
jgi:dUTP pyrophosphatase